MAGQAVSTNKKVFRVRLLRNIHLGSQKYAGKGSVISGSEGWLRDLVNGNQAVEVPIDTPLKTEELENVKPLKLFDASSGALLSEAQLKSIAGNHAKELKDALDAQRNEFQKQIDALEEQLKAKKDK